MVQQPPWVSRAAVLVWHATIVYDILLMLPAPILVAGRGCLILSRREFVMAVVASVTAYYLAKCLDWLITLITG